MDNREIKDHKVIKDNKGLQDPVDPPDPRDHKGLLELGTSVSVYMIIEKKKLHLVHQ